VFGVVALCDDLGCGFRSCLGGCAALGGCGELWHPWSAPQCVAQDGDHVEAVFGGGGEDPEDRVAVLGAVFAGEASGDVLLYFGRP